MFTSNKKLYTRTIMAVTQDLCSKLKVSKVILKLNIDLFKKRQSKPN